MLNLHCTIIPQDDSNNIDSNELLMILSMISAAGVALAVFMIRTKNCPDIHYL